MKRVLSVLLLIFGVAVVSLADTLTNGVMVDNLSGAAGDTLYYDIAIPENASNLKVSISDGVGDVDLYVKKGSIPTGSSFDCRPYLTGSTETCTFSAPEKATYYINLNGYSRFSGVALLATYDLADGGETVAVELHNGEVLSNLSGDSNSEQDFFISVPSGATNLNISITGGTGDADLYVRYASTPKEKDYDCRPYVGGNTESCEFNTPDPGNYYIKIVGYSSYAGLTLSAGYTGSGGGDSGSSFEDFESYYAAAIGQTGSALLNALNEAASRHHNRMTYSQVWDALKYTDEDPANPNNVILIYTRRSQAKSFNASGNSDPDAWNREHSWPKSHGFPDAGDWAYTDIHHLRPADASVNATRGNKDYDNGGASIGEAPGNFTDSDSFEPQAEVKGDLARMMFYMAVRYNSDDDTGTEDLELVDYTGTSGSRLGSVCTLLQWHNEDPVSELEINRHARIVERQGNRNPFVDFPAWANEIWGPYCE